MSIEVITTRDGSSSLFVPELNETYHSTHGALAESKYVFIRQGIDHYLKTSDTSTIDILEVGFGTGLNALLTALFSKKTNVRVNYHTLEPSALNKGVVENLNYCEQINDEGSTELFHKIHQIKWEELVPLTANFNIHKINKKLNEFESQTQFDIVYFDAFAPSKQPEMWVEQVFEKIFNFMKKGAVLVTYCAQGQFKRNLKAVGFEIESLPGPPPKKEMVRAIKP